MVGLSRSRFYQLLKQGVFPPPDQDFATGRPVYTQALQRQCLEVRRTNCGINGRPIVFYERRSKSGAANRSAVRKPSKWSRQHAELIEGLKSLGLSSVDPSQVDDALRELFPDGTEAVDPAEVLRAVFVRLQGRDSNDG